MVKAAYVGYASSSIGDEGIGPYHDDVQKNAEVPEVIERINTWDAVGAMDAVLEIVDIVIVGNSLVYTYSNLRDLRNLRSSYSRHTIDKYQRLNIY